MCIYIYYDIIMCMYFVLGSLALCIIPTGVPNPAAPVPLEPPVPGNRDDSCLGLGAPRVDQTKEPTSRCFFFVGVVTIHIYREREMYKYMWSFIYINMHVELLCIYMYIVCLFGLFEEYISQNKTRSCFFLWSWYFVFVCCLSMGFEIVVDVLLCL